MNMESSLLRPPELLFFNEDDDMLMSSLGATISCEISPDEFMILNQSVKIDRGGI